MDKVVRPILHQNELHLIYQLANDAIGDCPSISKARLNALKRLRKKIKKNCESITCNSYEEHRHYVPFVKSRIVIQEEERLNAIKEAENLAEKEAEAKQKIIDDEKYQRTKKIEANIEEHFANIPHGF